MPKAEPRWARFIRDWWLPLAIGGGAAAFIVNFLEEVVQ
jgi:hypothetical protein